MAGKKVTQAGIEKLDALGEDVVQDLRSEGRSVRYICAKLDVTARQLYGWLGWETKRMAEDEHGRSRRERWIQWSLDGAEHRAAQATERLENLVDPEVGRMKPGVTREEVALMKALAEEDRRSAGDMDPDRFKLNVNAGGVTNVSIGSLHLQAVQMVGGGAKRGGVLQAPVPSTASSEIEDVEYEVAGNDEAPEELSGASGDLDLLD